MRFAICAAVLASGLWAAAMTGCGGQGGQGDAIRVDGSDTMINLAQAWAEKYRQKHPEVMVQVQGGGSGVGIASLIDGVCDMANASREMQPKEMESIKAHHAGKEAVEHVVGYDALAVYVNKDNPLDTISIEELGEIYGEGSTITDWSQLGVPKDSPCAGKIALASRQNSSGTYLYFQEVVLGKTREFRLDAVKMNGSKDVVAHVASTPTAIGYSGMGYATAGVKMLKVSAKKGEPGVAPTVDNALNGSYPITRALYIYTVGEPTGAAKQYLDWIESTEGQDVVRELGYVPVSKP